MKDNIIKISGILGIVLGITAVAAVAVFPSRRLFNVSVAGIAFILLLFFFVSYFETFRIFSKKRSTHLGLNSILMIVFFVFIAVVFNLIARQYYFRADLSSTSGYSLAPQTVNIVEKLDEEMQIFVFGQEGKATLKKARELLEGYRYLNRNIRYSVTDLDRAPHLAKEFGVSQYDSIVVRGEGTTVVAQGISEEAITNAIIKSTRKTKKKLFFLTGHGERDINDNGREGVSKAVSRLNSIGYETDILALSAIEEVPKDATLLVIAGPAEKFSMQDIAKLNDYMDKDGKLIALFDPGFDVLPITGRAGLGLKEGIITDIASNLDGRNEKAPLVKAYPDSPVTRGFGLSTVFPGAAPLFIGGEEKRYEYSTIIEASPESRLMKNGRVVNMDGKHIIAAAAGSRKGRDILLVFGDSDFVSNAFIDIAGNGNLFLNSVNWVAEEGELISITPGKDNFIPLYITSDQGRIIMCSSVIGIPFFIFGAGFLVWWSRRRL